MAKLTIIRDGKSQEFTFTPPMLLDKALEQAGLSAEIASATNDNNGVKGRIRIGGRV